jgi:hypothetical protein
VWTALEKAGAGRRFFAEDRPLVRRVLASLRLERSPRMRALFEYLSERAHAGPGQE